jgi:glycine cleavage system aminomethyltransferase T
MYTDNIEDYYLTPWDLGYARMLKFKHDFVGRDALEEMAKGPLRERVTLVWNHDDVLKIMGSQLGDGPRYKSLEFPVTNLGWPHADVVRTKDGRDAGVSMHCGYSANEREALSLASIKTEFAQPGTELILTWGEVNGGSRKPHVERHEQVDIRVTVAPAPYASIARAKLPAPAATTA